MDKQYLSQERLDELTKELEALKSSKRVDVAERLKRAKEYGDLSENAEYAEAREEQSTVETRIFELEELLKKAEVIKKDTGGDITRVGSTVTVKKGDVTKIYTIVGAYEAKPEDGKISDESPIGHALLRHKVGDNVAVTTPTGQVSYLVTKIE